ncbi:MAG: valine--tRNA ligase [Chlamydiota bacterium]
MNDLPKSFDPKIAESKWYSFWEEQGFFKADSNSSKPAYTISIPPPNVTGVLHMGHALVNTLQDILTRYKRMDGYEALWVPGTDHAGISTQTVVERKLLAQEGKRRADYSREEFLKHVWAWKEESESSILGQLKKLGASCDWSRLRFTMDEQNNQAVRTAFQRLFDEGLIYRGLYLVNWDPVTETALADDEVEYEEVEDFIWYLKYPLKNGGFAVVATTRPETLLGDTAIAVNPDDERFKNLIGTMALVPFVNREIPIIADRLIDKSFGSGMVKVTPAHDPNDYQMGLNHQLPMINIMTPAGRINEVGGPFTGLTMLEARHKVVEEMRVLGLIEKIEPHKKRVGISYRSKAVIEPYLSKQWFVKMSGFAKRLQAAVREKKIKLIPESFESTYFHWVDNLRDWCISRQLWWGHRIPIWYKGEEMVCSSHSPGPDWVQDPDVLDTWFSSALWPFAVLGWPEKSADFQKFYPNNTLVTGHDILFFWVARMLLMGEYLTGELPFPETFLHGLIFGKSYWRKSGSSIVYVSASEREAFESGSPIPKDVSYKWEKMSKSKGNVIDPLAMIDKYGTDAVRMTLAASSPQNRQIDLDSRKFEEFKNFINKIWNGARFVLMNLEGPSEEGPLELEDEWILARLDETITHVRKHLDSYEFDKYANCAYDFFWNDFCSRYLEIAKPFLYGKTGTNSHQATKRAILLRVLSNCLKLLHPIAPFITEEIYSLLPGNKEPLIISTFPKPFYEKGDSVLRSFAFFEEIITKVRVIRGEMGLPPQDSTDLYLITVEESLPAFLKKHSAILKGLLPVKEIFITEIEPPLPFSGCACVGEVKIIVPLPESFLQKEKERLQKEQIKLQEQVAKLDIQLSNNDFISRAPPALVEKLRLQRHDAMHALKEMAKKL